MDIKFSMIVPAFNVEKHLCECIEFVIEQLVLY